MKKVTIYVVGSIVLVGLFLVLYFFNNPAFSEKISESKNYEANSSTTPRVEDRHNLDMQNVIAEEKLYYINYTSSQKDEIVVFSTKTMATSSFIRLSDPSFIEFDKSKRYLLYNDYFSGEVDATLYAYDFKNKETIPLYTDANADLYNFSPDGRYIIVDTGCCPGDRGRVFINLENKKIVEFGGKEAIWSPDSVKCAVSNGTVDINSLGWDGTNDSIYIVYPDEATTTDKLLLKADYKVSYFPVSWADNNNLIYAKFEYKEPFPSDSWSYPNQWELELKHWQEIYNSSDVSYWKIDVNTMKSIPTTEPEPVKYKNIKEDVFVPSSSGVWNAVFQYIDSAYLSKKLYVVRKDGLRIDLGNTGGAAWGL